MSDHLLPGPQPNLPAHASQGGAGARVPVAGDARATANAGEDVIDLREVFAVLRRHLVLVAGVAGVVTLLAGWLAFRARPVYQANAVIRIADTRSAMTAGLDNPIADKTLGMWTDPVLSQIQVLESRAVAAQVMERHPLGIRISTLGIPASALSDVALDSAATRDTLELEFADSGYTVRARGRAVPARYGAPVSVRGLAFSIAEQPARSEARVIVVPREAAVNHFLDDLDARARKNTDVIDVSYKTTDPVIAQEVVNTAVTAFQEINAATAQQESRRRREFVQTQLEQTDSILAAAQTALSSFASSKQVYGSDRKIAAEQAGVMDLEMKRGELAADRKMYQSLLDSLEKAKGRHVTEKLNAVVSSPDIAQNPVVQALYQQLVAYEAARDSLTTGPWGSARTNPDVQRMDALVATTQQRLTDATRSQIDALDARLSALDELKARTAAELQKLPATQAAEARLTQRVEATRKVADQLREEYQKARIAEAVEAGQVEVVDLAPLP
ncbi:MAG TPA: Wzz/FepE/Etk N-terminal domain-containing protein, partial [Gemmatimonadaceae bacterium]